MIRPSRAKSSVMNRTPDPTFGVQFSNEFGGNETSVMATASISLSGRVRRAASAEAGSQAVAAAARLRAAELDAARRYQQAQHMARTASKNLDSAEQAALKARYAMDRLKKGYAIGAVNLSDLISTRRVLTLTEQALVDYHVAAERAIEPLLAKAVSLSAFRQAIRRNRDLVASSPFRLIKRRIRRNKKCFFRFTRSPFSDTK